MTDIPNFVTAILSIKTSADYRMACNAMKMVHKVIQKTEQKNFVLGQRVTFTDKHGNNVFGLVTKRNPKTIQVLAEDTKTKWRVSPSLLKVA